MLYNDLQHSCVTHSITSDRLIFITNFSHHQQKDHNQQNGDRTNKEKLRVPY